MRQIAGLLLVLLPLSCSYNARWKATCDISFSLICSRQVECGQAFEQSQCEQELREQLFCDPSASLDDLKACRKAAATPGCDVAIPEICLANMCDTTLGCRDANDSGVVKCDDGGLTPEGRPCETIPGTGDTGP